MQHRITSNPFYQPEIQWQIRITAERRHMIEIGNAFEDIALATLDFETVEDSNDWRVDIITDVKLEHHEIEARLALVSGMLGIATPAYEIAILAPRDWLAEVESAFPPLDIGRFYIYGSHVKEKPPAGKIALQVSAGAAFGSGEHATTSSCLLALEMLARSHDFLRPLDMGCGSGILALAMARLWKVRVTGVDIDPVSVKVSRENARKNQLTALTAFGDGDGYHAPLCRRQAPYDLIVANILARPLMKMARQLAANLTPDGYGVLSGLLTTQENRVLAAHRYQGLKLAFRIRRGGWSALVLRF